MNIKLSHIVPAPWNTRGNITPTSVADLAKSIQEQGLINPITLWKAQTGEYYCIAGNRRLAALKLVNEPNAHLVDIKEGKDFVVFSGDEEDAKVVTVTENLQREDVGIMEEAAAVAALLDAGRSPDWIGARLGKSRSWVSRRTKLGQLDEAWKARANSIDADALEKIASYPADIQKRAAKVCHESYSRWKDISYYFNRESKDLDACPFCTDGCKGCLKRTGAEGDLFGIVDGKLGKCMDAKCFQKTLEAWIDAEIAKRTKGSDEVVRVSWSGDMPDEDESSTKKTKKFPCAYVNVKEYDGYKIEVRWGVSKAERDAEKARDDEKREAESAAEAKNREHIGSIVEKIRSFAYDGADEDRAKIEAIVAKAIESGDENVVAYAADLVVEDVCGWNSAERYANIVRTFPEIAEASGMTSAECDELCAEYPETDGEEED